MNRFSIAALCAIGCVAPVIFGGDAAKEAKLLDGKWVPLSAELAGRPFPDDVLKTIKLTINGNKYTVVVGDQTDRGRLDINPARKPKTMDVVGTEGPNKDKTFPAIYEADKQMLRICYDLDGQQRPTEFKTKEGTKQFLVTYKRAKQAAHSRPRRANAKR